MPQLAIHLDREVNDKGLVLDRQRHLAPVWALGGPGEDGLERFVAGELGVGARDVLSWDLMLHDVQRARARRAFDEEFIAAPRLDNLCSCHARLSALLAGRAKRAGALRHAPVLCLFDHEEVGSGSRARRRRARCSSAARAHRAGGRRRRARTYHRALARSFCVSADMAHATPPELPRAPRARALRSSSTAAR